MFIHIEYFLNFTWSPCAILWESWLETIVSSYNILWDEFGKCWLELLYCECHLWVSAYMRNHFWSGLSTTKKNKGMNLFFGDYNNLNTQLNEF